jgi:DNA-binding FadR family transcriptional regulator
MHEERLADRAYAGIVELINTDDLQIGDRLPSETRLAEMFGMSRTVVREALVRLASDGFTEARRRWLVRQAAPVRAAGQPHADAEPGRHHGQL